MQLLIKFDLSKARKLRQNKKDRCIVTWLTEAVLMKSTVKIAVNIMDFNFVIMKITLQAGKTWATYQQIGSRDLARQEPAVPT